MKRLLLGACIVALLSAAAAQSVLREQPLAFNLSREDSKLASHLRLNNDERDFQLAIVSDRTGGHRAKVFSRAVEQLNLLQPEFVVSVGDLIEGYTKDVQRLGQEWREFQKYVAQ